MTELGKLPYPDEFMGFLKDNGLDPSIYSKVNSAPRYIRLKPSKELDIQELEAELECKLVKIGWLPDFLSLPPHVQIARSKAYQDGQIYGIDAASGAAVTSLNILEGDHVLDLCAAPGAKLCMILDLLGDSGSLTGVDVARHRLAACRTMLQKYVLGDRCRLFVGDGTKFSLIPVRVSSNSKPRDTDLEGEVFNEWTSKRSWKEKKLAKACRGTQDPELIYYGKDSGVVGMAKSEIYKVLCEHELLRCGYDKVLVDAECTHDGSIKHIQKFENWGWETLQRRVLDAERTDSLTVLQLRLLTNGFRLLKVGGLLVYSTCSLTIAQNEDVVKQFLSENATAVLQEIDAAQNWPCNSGLIPKTLRFDPLTSGTSGLFVAKFKKVTISS